MKAGILGICAILLCHTVAEARYISKFVTQDDTREHGGDGDLFLLLRLFGRVKMPLVMRRFIIIRGQARTSK